MHTIYYFAHEPPVFGGQHVNVEHVCELRNMGLRAYLLYMPMGEVKRFESPASIMLHQKGMRFFEKDVIVIPEASPSVIRSSSSLPCRKIVHCQNPFYIFHSFPEVTSMESMGYREMISCSGYTTSILRKFGYHHPVWTVRPNVNPVFCESDSLKKLQIAFMPRKRERETVFLKGLFKSLYPQFKEVPWVPIFNMSREQCATVLRESAVFASFSFTEGLGLPPLEAMASGCIAVGFDGLGGEDYSNQENGFWVKEGDYFGYAHQLAQALKAAQTPLWSEELRIESQKTVARYSPDSFRADLKSAWLNILGDQFDDYLLESN